MDITVSSVFEHGNEQLFYYEICMIWHGTAFSFLNEFYNYIIGTCN